MPGNLSWDLIVSETVSAKNWALACGKHWNNYDCLEIEPVNLTSQGNIKNRHSNQHTHKITEISKLMDSEMNYLISKKTVTLKSRKTMML
jgi:hypothetical protein